MPTNLLLLLSNTSVVIQQITIYGAEEARLNTIGGFIEFRFVLSERNLVENPVFEERWHEGGRFIYFYRWI